MSRIGSQIVARRRGHRFTVAASVLTSACTRPRPLGDSERSRSRTIARPRRVKRGVRTLRKEEGRVSHGGRSLPMAFVPRQLECLHGSSPDDLGMNSQRFQAETSDRHLLQRRLKVSEGGGAGLMVSSHCRWLLFFSSWSDPAAFVRMNSE